MLSVTRASVPNESNRKKGKARERTLCIVLNALAVTLTCTRRSNNVDASVLACTFGSHVRRVFLSECGTLLPCWMVLPWKRPRAARLKGWERAAGSVDSVGWVGNIAVNDQTDGIAYFGYMYGGKTYRGNRYVYCVPTKLTTTPLNSGILQQIIGCKLFILVTRKVGFNDCLLGETKRLELHCFASTREHHWRRGKLTRSIALRSASVTVSVVTCAPEPGPGPPPSSALARSCGKMSGF